MESETPQADSTVTPAATGEAAPLTGQTKEPVGNNVSEGAHTESKDEAALPAKAPEKVAEPASNEKPR
jgi:hypothetical protein